MLKDILDSKKCFKLICGAGNENFGEIEKLVALYSLAGCRLFDVNASREAVFAAQKGLDFAIPKEAQKHYNLCISVGTKNDAHLNKAKINKKTCIKCGNCIKICPQNAITKNFEVKEENCIGCLKCLNNCPSGAIEIYSKNKPMDMIFKEIGFLEVKTLTNIELHTSGENIEEIKADWNFLNKNFDGEMLSICIGRAKIGNNAVLSLIKDLVKERKPYTTIIQTDGSPMSGGEDDFKTTLQAVAMAELVRKANLPVYILPSGGTNSKTAELAKICNVNINGVAVGSFARKIVKEYIERDDFLTNKIIFNEALKIAQNLVNKSVNL